MSITPKPKQSRVSFTEYMDILMLREALASEVFGHKNGEGWRTVAENLSQLAIFPNSLTPRTVRERTTLLMKNFKEENARNERSSGIEEDVTEKSALLEELINMRDECERKLADGKKKAEEEKAAGEAIRRQAMEGLRKENQNGEANTGTSETSSTRGSPPNIEPSTSTTPKSVKGRKRASEEKMLLYLEEKEKQRRKEKEEEMTLKRMELELQRERQEEELKLKREAEALAIEERRAFLRMMNIFVEKIQHQ